MTHQSSQYETREGRLVDTGKPPPYHCILDGEPWPCPFVRSVVDFAEVTTKGDPS